MLTALPQFVPATTRTAPSTPSAVTGSPANPTPMTAAHIGSVPSSMLMRAGVLDRAWYVERASQQGERTLRAADVDPASVPYFSLVVLPGLERP